MRPRRNAQRLILIALAMAYLPAISPRLLNSTSVSAQKGVAGSAQKTLDRLAHAREALAQASATQRSRLTKEAGRDTETALREFNGAVEARVAEILGRLAELSDLLGENVSTPFDIRGEGRKPPDPAALAEYQRLQAELAALSPVPSAPGNINSATETEPNNTSGTANALGLGVNECRVATGAITAGDIDFWSFTAPAGARVWAYVDTGGGQSSPANDRDSFLTLFDTNGATILEEDDDDATGNGGDSGTESGFGSTIAGRTVGAGGTYFLAVEGFGPTSVINPYRLFVVVSTGGGAAEAEPNGTTGTANPALAAGGTLSFRTGSITPAGDVDFYSIVASAGDVFYISADGNPERDATNTDMVVDLIHPDGRSLMSPPVDSGLGGSATNPEGESFNFEVPTGGTYFVRVSGFGTSTGTYGLILARCSAQSICPVTEFSGILGQNSVAYPGISGIQDGRLNRFADQTGACNNVRTCPGLSTLGLRPFDAYSFSNASPNNACVTVTIDAQACLGNNFLVVVAYLGAYNPAAQCTGYLADIGSSPNPTGVFSFNVPGNATFTLVITSANASPTVCTTPYRVTVVGLPTFATSIQDQVTGDTLLINCLTGRYTFVSCSTGVTVSGTIGCVQFGCNLIIGGGGGKKGGPATVNAQINTCAGTGTATVTLNNGTTFNLSDGNIHNNSCLCP